MTPMTSQPLAMTDEGTSSMHAGTIQVGGTTVAVRGILMRLRRPLALSFRNRIYKYIFQVTFAHLADPPGRISGGLYGYTRRAWLYAKTPPMQTTVPRAESHVTGLPK